MKFSLLFALVGFGALLTENTAVAINLRDDENEDTENVQVENIYGIPSDKEKLQMKAKKLSKQKKELMAKKKKEYHE